MRNEDFDPIAGLYESAGSLRELAEMYRDERQRDPVRGEAGMRRETYGGNSIKRFEALRPVAPC